MNECVVIKFHDKERYAACICGGSKEECIGKAAYANGLYHDVSYITFGVFPEFVWDKAKEVERTGGVSTYEFMNTISF